MKNSVLSGIAIVDGSTNGSGDERAVLRLVREALRSEAPRVRFQPRPAAA